MIPVAGRDRNPQGAFTLDTFYIARNPTTPCRSENER